MENTPILDIVEVAGVKRQSMRLKTYNKAHFVISCRVSGSCSFCCGKQKEIVEKGDVLYIPHGSSYFQESEAEEVIYIHLLAYSPMPDEMRVFKTKDPAYVCGLFEKCYAEFLKKDNNSKLRCMSVLYEILSFINWGSQHEKSGGGTAFASALEYMRTHMYDSDFGIEKLCSNCAISRTYFNRLFKQTFDTTPNIYINKERIKKSFRLLDGGNYTNEEVAVLCGFKDVKYFYVTFKKITGMTTHKYKNRAK